MPKLKDLHVRANANGNFDIGFSRVYSCKVLTDGVFYAAIDDDALLAEFQAMYVDQIVGVGSWLTNDTKHQPQLAANTLHELQAALQAHARSKVETTQETTTVIFYWQDDSAHYFVTDNGLVEPNGFGSTTGSWNERRSSFHGVEGYAVSIGAVIAERTVSTSATGVQSVTYARPLADDLGPHGCRLCRFTRMPWPNRPTPRMPTEQAFVPYTEKSAKLFADLLQEACDLAERRKTFFANVDTLAKDIESGMKP